MEKILFSFLNLLVLVGLLYFFTKRSAKDYMKKRSIDFKDKKTTSEMEYEGQEQQSIALAGKLKNVRGEIGEILAKAEEEGVKRGAKLLSEAEKVADRIIEQSRIRVDNEIKKRGREFVEQMVDSSIKNAEAALAGGLTKESHVKIGRSYIKKFGEARELN